MTNEEKAILEKCGIHYENDTLEKEIALRVITETRKQFKEFLEKKHKKYTTALSIALQKNLTQEAAVYDKIQCLLLEIINEHFKEN